MKLAHDQVAAFAQDLAHDAVLQADIRRRRRLTDAEWDERERELQGRFGDVLAAVDWPEDREAR